MKKMLSLLVFFPLLFGCMPNSFLKINSDALKDIAGRNVLIIAPSLDSTDYNDPDDVLANFPEYQMKPKRRLLTNFYGSLADYLKIMNRYLGDSAVVIDSLLDVSSAVGSNRIEMKLPLGPDNDSTLFYVPARQWLIDHGKSPDIVAMMNSIVFHRSKPGFSFFGSGGGWGKLYVVLPQGTLSLKQGFMEGISEDFIACVTYFIIYDYKRDTWISYGVQVAASNVGAPNLTRRAYTMTYRGLLKRIFENTPYEARFDKF
jgi:hypothetical protein